jgi:dephospho-CoA kinase
MRVIGITGGIASGKSLVSRQLAEYGAPVVNADTIGHEAYRQGTETHRAVIDAFGPGIVGPDGEIDRKALGARVFGDPQARARLEGIVWPVMRRMMEQRLARLRAEGVPVAVLEAALLIEADWLPLVDEVWLVTAPRKTALKRLTQRNGLSQEEAEARLRAQPLDRERRPYADVMIHNDRSLEELRARVDQAWNELTARVRTTA